MNVTMQDVVDSLEAYKRQLGRQYDKLAQNSSLQSSRVSSIAKRYNDVEYQIRWLCNKYDLHRSTIEYLL